MVASRSVMLAVMAILFALLCLAPVRAEPDRRGIGRSDHNDNRYQGRDDHRRNGGSTSSSESAELKWLAEQECANNVAAKTLSGYECQLGDLTRQLATVAKQVQQDECELANIVKLVRALLADAKCSNTDRQSLQRILSMITKEQQLIDSTQRGVQETQRKIHSLQQLIERAECAIKEVASVIKQWRQSERRDGDCAGESASEERQEQQWRATIERQSKAICALLQQIECGLQEVKSGVECASRNQCQISEGLAAIRAAYACVGGRDRDNHCDQHDKHHDPQRGDRRGDNHEKPCDDHKTNGHEREERGDHRDSRSNREQCNDPHGAKDPHHKRP